jgi:hypothetical protein
MPEPAEVGVKPTEIIIGQCAALSGPAAGLGMGTQAGLRAAIEEVNARGVSAAGKLS